MQRIITQSTWLPVISEGWDSRGKDLDCLWESDQRGVFHLAYGEWVAVDLSL